MKKIKHWTVTFKNGESKIAQGSDISVITVGLQAFGYPIDEVISIVFLKES